MATINTLYLKQKSGEVFINNLHHLMLENSITEAELARRTKIPQPTLHKILTGKTADPRVSTLQSLANYFGLTVDELFTGLEIAKRTQTNTQSIPIISWSDSIQGLSLLNKLSPSNWDEWIVTESIAKNAFGLESKPSMEPRFPKKTILIIDPSTCSKDGDLVIVHYPNTEEATLRELSIDGPNQMLLPIKPNLPTDKLTDDFKILGVVVQSRFSYGK
ncbi:LexA family protein [Candidiatus Paracoxiella cheracis]|uniref:LexA family protein n=1 Tax=Candidiatus Paracoxiella cheracis TaxID=3405120 RepID=UPI003BF57414